VTLLQQKYFEKLARLNAVPLYATEVFFRSTSEHVGVTSAEICNLHIVWKNGN
jgi:hypothetical protein